MPVSPRDFELYSRMTGNPMPTDAMSRMQMAPDVYNFTKSIGRNPNIFEKTGNLLKNIGKGAVMAVGLPAVAESFAAEQQRNEEQRDRMEQLKQQAAAEPPELTEAERKEIAIQNTARVKADEAIRVEQEKNFIKNQSQQPTTADQYAQNYNPNQTAAAQIGYKTEQGSEITENPTIAEVLSTSQDSMPASNLNFGETDLVGTGGGGKEALNQFMKKKGLDTLLAGAFSQRDQDTERVGDSIPLASIVSRDQLMSGETPLEGHPDMKPGEDDSGVPTQQNLEERQGIDTGATEDIEDMNKEMRKIAALERIAEKSPSTKQIALSEMNKSREGFMAQDGANQPAYEAKKRVEEKTAAKQKVDDLKAKFVEGAYSIPIKGQYHGKSLGLTVIPATNGEAQRGFVIANKAVDSSPTTATTYGFGISPKSEDYLKDYPITEQNFDAMMERGMTEAKQRGKRKAGEIFGYLSQPKRVVTGKAQLGGFGQIDPDFGLPNMVV